MRQNSVDERRAIFDYLLRQKKDHQRNHSITTYEIGQECDLDTPALNSALRWLEKQNLIHQQFARGWMFKAYTPVAFCWVHGTIREGTIDCPKCSRRRARLGESQGARGETEEAIQNLRTVELRTA